VVRYYDDLPTSGSDSGRAFRDLEWEAWPVALKPNDLLRSSGNLILEDHTDYTLQDKVLKICQDLGVGAQFGGKYFAHDV
jgi:fumarate hydratase class I